MSSDGDPTVLSMINNNLNVIGKDVKDIKKELKEGAVKMENHDVRLGNIESDVKDLKSGQKKIKKSLWDHISGPEGKKKHYNQGYTETFSQRTWRRKDLIALMSVIMGAIVWVSQNWPG